MKLVTIGLATLSILCLASTGEAATATCSFNSSPTLSFGNLDPGVGTDLVVTAAWSVNCKYPGPPGGTFAIAISDDDGLYSNGANANRMINLTCPVGTAYLPYNLEYTTPVTGRKNIDIPITFTGKILGALYQDACIGGYTDTVTITVSP